jgi:mono/diheme cytochrome c family protein
MRAFKLTFVAAALLCSAAACGDSAPDNRQTSNASRPAANSANTAASATPAAAAAPDELAQAAEDYKNVCIKCHKADGSGGTLDMDGHEAKVPDLRTHGRKDSDKELAEQIAEGGDDMPAFKNKLDAARINNLVRYIRREFHGQTPSAPGAGAPAGSNAPAQPAH